MCVLNARVFGIHRLKKKILDAPERGAFGLGMLEPMVHKVHSASTVTCHLTRHCYSVQDSQILAEHGGRGGTLKKVELLALLNY